MNKLMVSLMAVVFVVLSFVYFPVQHAQARSSNDTRVHSSPWYDGCITKQYGWGEGAGAEHGNDVSCFGYGTPITALLSGTVSYAGWTSFGYYEVTWRLDNPGLAKGSPYAYAEDMSGIRVWAGEHVYAGETIGWSETWVEFGLTPDWAYGISNWRWGVNSYFLIIEARNGDIGYYAPPPPPVVHPEVQYISGNIHIVRPGETLWSIVGYRWQTVCVLNALANCNLIYPGERLRV